MQGDPTLIAAEALVNTEWRRSREEATSAHITRASPDANDKNASAIPLIDVIKEPIPRSKLDIAYKRLEKEKLEVIADHGLAHLAVLNDQLEAVMSIIEYRARQRNTLAPPDTN